MDRRRLLGLASASAASLSGCLGTGMAKDAVVRAAPADPGGIDPVEYGSLPEAERAIADAAVEDGLYHACPDLPDAVRSFANRFDGLETAYLARQGATYGLYVRITDQVFATTVSPPERDPSCGFL